jgi:beta-galactosidase
LLKAVGVDNNKEKQSAQLRTAGKAVRLKLTADHTTIQANGQDLSFVTVEITDENGNIQPNANNELVFSMKGAGVIAGVDNANLKDTDPYVSNKRTAWKGRALVVIKSTHQPGNIELKASSPGLLGATIILKGIK